MTALCNSPIGKEQTVKWIFGSNSDLESIRSLGITEGSSVRVIGSFFGSIIVALNETRYAMDNELAYHIKVG